MIPTTESPKQHLIGLHQKGELNDLQLRAMAKRLDELGGSPNALKQTLAEYDAGEIRVESRPAKHLRPPSIFDAPDGESPKQTLIWLFEQGSVNRTEMQAAAALLDQQHGAVDREGLAALLAEVGAVRALPVADEPDAETAESDGEDEDVTPFPEDVLAFGRHTLAHSIPAIKQVLEAVKDITTLDCLHYLESEAKKPRQGVLDAIEERLGEITLMLPEE